MHGMPKMSKTTTIVASAHKSKCNKYVMVKIRYLGNKSQNDGITLFADLPSR